MGPCLRDQLAKALPPDLPERLGVAVSGGGDSTALLVLLAELQTQLGFKLQAVTVDHGLRPEAAKEAAQVAALCGQLGVPHDILRWEGWAGQGNLQHEARAARSALMADWAQRQGLGAIALGHTAEDQAETLLLRLARRAGVDGLAGMAGRHQRAGMTWLRPMLGLGRADLRAALRTRDIGWSEDPSNEDLRFDRVKMRQALAALSPLGIDAEALGAVAGQMAEARAALDHYTVQAAARLARTQAGAVVLETAALWGQPDEIIRRLLLKALDWVHPQDYPPRRAALAELTSALRAGQGATVAGCQGMLHRGEIWIFREYQAVAALSVPQGALWDGLWQIEPAQAGEGADDLRVTALGAAGLRQCPDWRATGLPRALLLASPALWRGDHLVAAPLAGWGQNWHAVRQGGKESF